ncbi:MAG TPA: hypothetical protein VFT12_09070 [Thermoanaerobaculia bacterium]|nr:hypothetical protein [Thermoanaerobaculia bacterium]
MGSQVVAMRFTIEQRHLTDDNGKPVAANSVTYHSCDAETVDQAIESFIRHRAAEVIGNVMKFPGFQAMATVRDGSGVYTLQFTPASGRFVAV